MLHKALRKLQLNDFTAEGLNERTTFGNEFRVRCLASGFNQVVLRERRDIRRADDCGPPEDVHLCMKIRYRMHLDAGLDEYNDFSRVDLSCSNRSLIEFSDQKITALQRQPPRCSRPKKRDRDARALGPLSCQPSKRRPQAVGQEFRRH
jgi:hypothetical protein